MSDLIDIRWFLGPAAPRGLLGLRCFVLHNSSMTRLLERFKLKEFQSSPLPNFAAYLVFWFVCLKLASHLFGRAGPPFGSLPD